MLGLIDTFGALGATFLQNGVKRGLPARRPRHREPRPRDHRADAARRCSRPSAARPAPRSARATSTRWSRSSATGSRPPERLLTRRRCRAERIPTSQRRPGREGRASSPRPRPSATPARTPPTSTRPRHGAARGARAPPPRDRRPDPDRARDDEGRGDEARADAVVRRPRRRPARRPARVPAQARRAARLGARRCRSTRMMRVLEEDLGRAARDGVRRLRRGADRRRLDRPGLPRDARTTAATVAVKVQYPGVAAAVRADMKNLALLMRLVAARAARDRHRRARRARSGCASARSSTTSSRRDNQHAFAAAFRGHPFIVVPGRDRASCAASGCSSPSTSRGPASSSSRPRPTTSATASARSSTASSAARCTAATSSPATPTPATSCSRPTAASRSSTSGCSSGWTPASVELELACQRAAAEGRAGELHALMAGGRDPARARARRSRRAARLRPRRRRLVPGRRGGRAHAGDGDRGADRVDRCRSRRTSRCSATSTCRPSTSLARRLELFTQALLGQLGASANWHRIAREWMYGEPPATELGELEAGVLRGGGDLIARLALARRAAATARPRAGCGSRSAADPRVGRISRLQSGQRRNSRNVARANANRAARASDPDATQEQLRADPRAADAGEPPATAATISAARRRRWSTPVADPAATIARHARVARYAGRVAFQGLMYHSAKCVGRAT